MGRVAFQGHYSGGARQLAKDSGQFICDFPAAALADIPSIQEMCNALPPEVVFCVEVKYPPPSVQAAESAPYPAFALFVDRTLPTLAFEAAKAIT
jgi:hypothetical protein